MTALRSRDLASLEPSRGSGVSAYRTCSPEGRHLGVNPRIQRGPRLVEAPLDLVFDGAQRTSIEEQSLSTSSRNQSCCDPDTWTDLLVSEHECSVRCVTATCS